MSQNAAPNVPASTDYTGKVILDLCQRLFNQDARIITSLQYITGPRFPGLEMTAIVLPVACSLESLAVYGAKTRILLQATEVQLPGGPIPSCDQVLRTLLHRVEQKIGEVLQIDNPGGFHVSKLSLLEGYAD